MGNSIFKNSIYKVTLNFCNIIIPIIIGPYIARVLDIELFGIYNNAIAQIQVVIIIASFGIYNYGMREVSKFRDNKTIKDKIFCELFSINFVIHIVSFVLYIWLVFCKKENTELIIYFILSFELLADLFSIEWYCEAFENYKFITYKTIVIRLLYLILILLFVRKSDDIIPYTIIMTLIYFLNSLVSFCFIFKQIDFKFKNLAIFRHLKPLICVLIISNVDLLYTQLDKIMLGKFVIASAVTMYQIPQFITGLVSIMVMSIGTVSLPRLFNILKNDGREEYEKMLKLISNGFLILYIPCCIGLLSLSYEIMYIYGGEKYISASSTLFIFAIAKICDCNTYINNNLILYVNEKEKKILIFNFIGGLINLLLNFIFIINDIFTTNMAVVSLAISYFVANSLSGIYISYVLKYKNVIFNKNNLIYFLLSLSFIPITYLTKLFVSNIILRSIIIIATCSFVYFGILLITKNSGLIKLLKSIKNKE